MIEDQIQQLQAAALERIEEAKDRDALEQVRVDVLGRKGVARAVQRRQAVAGGEGKAGKALNAAKQVWRSAFETKDQALRRRRSTRG